MTTLIIMGLCALPLFILGLFMKKGKGLMLLAGYNTMPKEERDKIDKKELSKKAGNLMIRVAILLALSGVAMYFRITWATIAAFAIITIDACVVAIRMPGKSSMKMSKIGIAVSVVITVAVFIGVGMMIYNGEKDPVVNIMDNQIQIEAMYGVSINYSDIKTISLIDKSMRDIEPEAHRDNGYGGFGDSLKGYFSSDVLGKFTLFVKANSSPTIRIQSYSDQDIYINFSDAEKTETLYQQMIEAAPQK